MKIAIRIVCLSFLLGSALVAQAANTIDPNTTGATDVVQDLFGTPAILTNPLPDPLTLGDLDLAVGDTGSGELLIDNGSSVSNQHGYIGHNSGSTGVATVSGSGSQWNNSERLYVGSRGDGTLNVEAGGVVSNSYGYIGSSPGSTGVATVSGSGSQWNNSRDLYVGFVGTGTLNVEAGGVVSVGGTLTIDNFSDGDSFINMSTGGMLALFGEAESSLAEFLDLINGTDAIRYWDDSLFDWADITSATYGDDYTLGYLTSGDLSGYTVLTVGVVPEPSSLVLIAVGLLLQLSFGCSAYVSRYGIRARGRAGSLRNTRGKGERGKGKGERGVWGTVL